MGTVYRQEGRTLLTLKYYRDRRPIVESTGTDDKTKAWTVCSPSGYTYHRCEFGRLPMPGSGVCI